MKKRNTIDILAALSQELIAKLGCGFGLRKQFCMTRFAEAFADSKIVSAVGTQSTKGAGR